MRVTSKALWFVEAHLATELSLDAIAENVGVTRFHLSRAFGSAIGTPLVAYIRARRLSVAAAALAAGAPDILSVALEAGYGSHEAFTRAFSQHFGKSPEQIRAQAHLNNISIQEPLRMYSPGPTSLPPPRIVDGKELRLFGLSQHHHETNAGMAAQWSRFTTYLGHIPGQIGGVAYGVVYNAQNTGCDYLCAVEINSVPSQPKEFISMKLAAHRYAVFQHSGHISTIGDSWQQIWEHTLSSAGLKAVDAPCLERYDETFDGRTGLGVVEIWIPIAP